VTIRGSGQDVERVVHFPEQIAERLVDELPESWHVDADQRAAALANRAAGPAGTSNASTIAI
jgi:hypothetical protein